MGLNTKLRHSSLTIIYVLRVAERDNLLPPRSFFEPRVDLSFAVSLLQERMSNTCGSCLLDAKCPASKSRRESTQATGNGR